MATDGFAGLHCCCNLGVHLVIAAVDAGEIHHLAQADDAGPGHRFSNFGRADGRAGRFQAGGTGDAGGHLDVDVDGQGLGFVVHQFDAG